MGFAAEVLGNVRKPGTPCLIRVALDSFTDEERADYEAVVANERIPRAAITAALHARGFECGKQAVVNHANGKCACGPR
jgi:hypothetical protein